jgi:hypothetical protein
VKGKIMKGKIMKLAVMKFSPASSRFVFVTSIQSGLPVPKHPPTSVLPLTWDTKFHTHRTEQIKLDISYLKIYVLR